jgi:flagellar protein FlaG
VKAIFGVRNVIVTRTDPVPGPAEAGRVTETGKVQKLSRVVRNPERQAEKMIRAEDIEEALRQANLATEEVNVSLRFRVHESSERVMVQVVDVNRNEVVREIPPRELLDLVGNIREMIGVLLDEKR